MAVFAGKRELLTDESVGNAKALLHEQIGRLQVDGGRLPARKGDRGNKPPCDFGQGVRVGVQSNVLPNWR